jgi:hypothetical protein
MFPYGIKCKNQYSVLTGRKIQRTASEYYWLRAWYTAVDYDMLCGPDPSVYKDRPENKLHLKLT